MGSHERPGTHVDPRSAAVLSSGRVHQKARTRAAIVQACREIIASGSAVSMAAVARAASVSEPTAYRYFPDLYSLLLDALAGMWPTPEEAMAPVAGSDDPAERVAFAAEALGRLVVSWQGAIRAMIAATIGRPDLARSRPGVRLGLIDLALDPLDGVREALGPAALARLKRDLAVIISAESVFSLVDLYQLSTDDAVASLARSARAVTRDALAGGTKVAVAGVHGRSPAGSEQP